MARTSSVVVGVGAVVAVLTAAIVTLGLRGPGWRNVTAAVARIVRGEDDHPQWELLMQ